MTIATIQNVDIGASHDGEAELLVTLEYGNGGRTQVTLDEFAVRTLLSSQEPAEPTSALVGVLA